MRGKEKCRILRQIRREIAENNDIEFVTAECRYQGECRGTCPKCESELAYLEAELEKKRKIGRRIALAGISVGTMAALAGCSAIESLIPSVGASTPTPEIEVLDGEIGGDVSAPETQIEELTGEVAEPRANAATEELDGYVAQIDVPDDTVGLVESDTAACEAPREND